MSRFLRSWIIVALAAALLSSCGPSEPPGSARSASPSASAPATESPSSPSVSQSADDAGLDFSVKTFAGTEFSLADHRGTPVVLNFWESW